MNENDVGQDKKEDEELAVPVAWEALEDAFENNAPEVHSYLHFDTGEVIRIVDGVADPSMHTRIMNDARYLRIDPVSSREQYRWMERFIATVEDEELRRRLNIAIDGKGAFRRFKDVLLAYPVERERWFAYRSNLLHWHIQTWLANHELAGQVAPPWGPVSEPEDLPEAAAAPPVPSGAVGESLRRQAREILDEIAPLDLPSAIAFLEFLQARGSAAVATLESPEVPEEAAVLAGPAIVR